MGLGKIPLTSSECASSWMRYTRYARAWLRQKGLSLHEAEGPSASAAMLMPVACRLSGMKRDLDGQLERPTPLLSVRVAVIGKRAVINLVLFTHVRRVPGP